MWHATHAVTALTLSILLFTPITANSSNIQNTAANDKNNTAGKNLERRINTLEKKFLKQSAAFKIDGFLSAAYARSDDTSITGSWGGITDKNDFAALSNIGIQMSFQANPKTQIITQWVARGEEEWSMEAEWAYLSLNLSDYLTFRFGRQKAPLYLLSEYIELGYANPWVAAPDEVYGITGDSTYNGISLLHTIPGKNWNTTLQLMWGNNSFNSPVAGNVSLNDLRSLSVTSSNDSFTFRLGYNLVSGDVPSLSIPLPAMPNIPIQAGDTLNFDEIKTKISYLAAGFIYDDKSWLVMSEYAQLKIEGWLSDITGSYLTTGYHFNKFMPHITLAKMENKDPSARDIGTVISSATGATLPLPGAMAGSIADTFIVQNQTTYTLGLRYELLPAVSLKAELSHITDFNGSGGKFLTSSPPTGGHVNLMKFSIDSVF
ncbi:MAG: hypothetical protein KUG80_02030 [Gammaproteobacteria bacterium]|nr:hypothetical protein [Gammaproteobacteria bacterium]